MLSRADSFTPSHIFPQPAAGPDDGAAHGAADTGGGDGQSGGVDATTGQVLAGVVPALYSALAALDPSELQVALTLLQASCEPVLGSCCGSYADR